MNEIKYEVTELGELNGVRVIVATDCAGSNVIIGGGKSRGHIMHYLSPEYKNHKSAVMIGKRIMTMKKIPKRFIDMNGPSGTSHSFGMLEKMAINSYFKNRR
jgi:hypothetical protein